MPLFEWRNKSYHAIDLIRSWYFLQIPLQHEAGVLRLDTKKT